jgi:hypothetical protein
MRPSFAIVLSSITVVALGCSSTNTPSSGGGGGGPCGSGTVDVNGVCEVPYSPPPSQSMGSGATIYFWASASAGGVAQGRIYAIVDGYSQGEMTGYATSGNPTCGSNAIYSVIVYVTPGKSYTLSAHDQYNVEWSPQSTPVITPGECFSFQLN